MQARIPDYLDETSQDQLYTESIPGFSILLWDSIKTTAFFAGIVPGIPAAAGGYMGGMVLGVPEVAGLFTGCVAAFPFSLSASLLFALPLAGIAQTTRDFRSIDVFEPTLALLNKWFIHDQTRNLLIETIIAEDKKNNWGLRSFESFILLCELKSEDDTSVKWHYFLEYVNAITKENIYIHNGKKLFNTILECIESKKEIAQNLTSDLIFIQAIEKNQLSTIQSLLNEFPESLNNKFITHDRTPLQYAVEKNNREACQVILQSPSLKFTCQCSPALWYLAKDPEVLALIKKHDKISRKQITNVHANFQKLISIIQNTQWNTEARILHFFTQIPPIIQQLRKIKINGQCLGEIDPHTVTDFQAIKGLRILRPGLLKEDKANSKNINALIFLINNMHEAKPCSRNLEKLNSFSSASHINRNTH